MDIASRTPEGEPNRCRVCGHESRVEPSTNTHDATCPECGNLMWYPQSLGTKPPRLSPETISRFYRATALLSLERRFGMPAPPEIRMKLGGSWSIDDSKKWEAAAEQATSFEDFVSRGPA
jgi:hypothetical protein